MTVTVRWWGGRMRSSTIDERLEEIARERHGVIDAAVLDEIGLSVRGARHRVNARRLEAMPDNTWVVPHLRDPYTDLSAALTRHPRIAGSHRAAAATLKLDGFRPRDNEPIEPEVSVPHGIKRPDIRLVHRTRDLFPPHLTVVSGLQITNVPRTLVDLGKVTSLDRIELAVEHALRDDLTSLDELWRIQSALSRPGRPGPKQLREVLRRRPEGAVPTGSPLETVFVQVLRRFGIPQPARQVEVWLGDELVAISDFGWLATDALVEIDGFEAHSGRPAFRRDRVRQNDLEDCGFTVHRFTAEDLFQTPVAVARRCRRYAVVQSQRDRVIRFPRAA